MRSGVSKAPEREGSKATGRNESERNSLVKLSAERCSRGRAAHVTVKATDSILKPDGMLDVCGVWSGGTLGKNIAEQERPSAKNGRYPPDG